MAAFLLGIANPGELRSHNLAGALLENLVYAQLLAWRETETLALESFTGGQLLVWKCSGVEVDFVIQSRQGLLPMEIKMTSRARAEDIRSRESFLDEYPKQAPLGLLFYGGEETLRKMVIP